MKKRMVSLLLTVAMVFSIFAVIPIVSVNAASNMTLAQLQAKFPAGKYWNHAGSSVNNPDGYTSTPCTHHGSCSYYGKCGCNSFGNSIQCFGFANKLAYDAFGSLYTSWGITSLNNLKAGDVIRYKNNGHSIFVTAVNGDTITYGDCNSDGHCKIRWGATISKSTVASTLTAVYSAPSTLSYDTNPPTNVYLDKNQYWYDIQDTITLYPHADGATYYWLSVYKGDNHIVDTCIYGEYSFSASQWGYGDYYAWITAGNSVGGTDSEGISFSVVEAPKYSNINSSKPIYDIDDTVSITVDSVCAKGQCIGIDKEGVGRVVTESCDSTFTISASKLGIGSYSAYFTIWNGSGSVDTKRIIFNISERKNLGDEFYAYIKHQSSGLYLTNQLGDEYGNVIGKEPKCEKNQVWKFTRLSNGTYKICSTVDDSYMDVRGGADVDAANVITYEYYGNSNQQFYIYNQYGAYYLRPTHSSTRVLDMSAETNNLEIWRMGDNWIPQKFDIEKIERSEIGVHKYIDKIVSPTTNNDGYTEHICSICGYSYKDSYTHLDDLKSEDYNISLSSNSYTYDGKAKTPTVTVKNDVATLLEDTDYTVKYTNNINAGTATVTVTGIGNYTGTMTKNFTISKASQILSAEIASNKLNVGATSKITAKGQGAISYTSNNTKVATVNSSGVLTGISTGTAEITVTASGNSNYKPVSKTFTIMINKDYTLGDVDRDGEITITDATLIQKHIANMISFTEEQQKTADVTNDGKINVDDVTFIQKHLAGLI